MTFTGKELFELGVPKAKIKFFVGREFSSKDELLGELHPKELAEVKKIFTWIDWLWETFDPSWMPMKMNGTNPERMSKSELKRLFDSKSIEVNGTFPTSLDECSSDMFPIKSFIWFPNGKRRTHWI